MKASYSTSAANKEKDPQYYVLPVVPEGELLKDQSPEFRKKYRTIQERCRVRDKQHKKDIRNASYHRCKAKRNMASNQQPQPTPPQLPPLGANQNVHNMPNLPTCQLALGKSPPKGCERSEFTAKLPVVRNGSKEIQERQDPGDVSSYAPYLSKIIVNDKHRILADEPVHVAGGQDLGPTPYDLLLSGLGTCTVMTLRMFVNRKNKEKVTIPMEGITVTLTHNKIRKKIHEEIEESSDSRETRSKRTTSEVIIDHIERQIRVDGDELTDSHKQRLLDIANKCPVHKTIAYSNSQVEVVTTIV